MNLRVATQPTEEPVTLDEAKAHLRVDTDNDDALIATYLRAARLICEDTARRSFVTRTYDLFLDAWFDCVKLPLPPAQEIVGIWYTPDGGIETQLDPSNYVTDTTGEPGRIVWALGKSAPSATLKPISGVRIRYTAGYGDAADVPDHYKAALLLVLGHLYENREEIGFQSAYKLPMGAESILLMDRGYR